MKELVRAGGQTVVFSRNLQKIVASRLGPLRGKGTGSANSNLNLTQIAEQTSIRHIGNRESISGQSLDPAAWILAPTKCGSYFSRSGWNLCGYDRTSGLSMPPAPELERDNPEIRRVLATES